MPTLGERFGVQRVAIAAASSGDNTVLAGVPNRRIIVLNYVLVNSVATAQAVTWKSGAGTSLSGAIGLPSSIGGALVIAAADAGLFETARGAGLVINLSAASAVAGHLSYVVPNA